MAMRAEPRLHYCVFDTAMGACGAAWSAHGLARLRLPEADRAATERRLRRTAAQRGDPPPAIAEVIADVRRYLAGERVDFSAVTVDFADVSPLHRRIYQAARAVGWGETVSYGELAARAGVAGEAQEVGQAMAHNPVVIVVPCHRVLAAGRKLGGFSAYGGTFTKGRLLELEGVWLGDDAPRLPGF